MAYVWHSAAETHRGNHRPINEDAVLSRPDAALWAVADGLGGHAGGRLASRAVIDALAQAALPARLTEQVDAIDDLLQRVNEQLRRQSRAAGSAAGMGSTVLVLLCVEATAVALWAGDSRLYRLRDGDLELITRDHSPVWDLLDAGGLTEAEALASESHLVTRAVGCYSRLHLDVAVIDVCPGDTFLLCTDGCYRALDQAEFGQALAAGDLTGAAHRLLAHCLAGDAPDNVSLVVARADLAGVVPSSGGRA